MLATQNSEGEGTSGAGRRLLLLLCQFTRGPGCHLQNHSRRPGGLGTPCGLSSALPCEPALPWRLGLNRTPEHVGVCTHASGWQVHTYQLSCPLPPASPPIWGRTGLSVRDREGLAFPYGGESQLRRARCRKVCIRRSQFCKTNHDKPLKVCGCEEKGCTEVCKFIGKSRTHAASLT